MGLSIPNLRLVFWLAGVGIIAIIVTVPIGVWWLIRHLVIGVR